MFETKSSSSTSQEKSSTQAQSGFSAPAISLPKGGGAIRGIGEKFAANAVTGTGSMSVPIATSPGRSGLGPQLNLTYDSGSGNGPFGFGWSLSLPSITRKTDKGLPQYKDAEESDVYILSGAEDLVPTLVESKGGWVREPVSPRVVENKTYNIQRYRPRIEGLFARIERWTEITTGEIHWRSITRDNVTTLYGKDKNSRIIDPADPAPDHPTHIFSWLICQSYDDKGNAIVYEYAEENDDNIDRAKANERNRLRTANRYLKRVKYGNRAPNRDENWQATNPAKLDNKTWMFEVVFDYDEGHYQEFALDPTQSEDQHRFVLVSELSAQPWSLRMDPFSSYRASFEVRTYRLCRRVLMFHCFPQELGINDCLVRSTEFSYSESPVASFITSVTQSGYVRQPLQSLTNRYLKKSLPPLEFEYSQVPSPEQLAQQPICDVDQERLQNLPTGLDGTSYQWIDLDGEGTSGILTEQADGWYYKRNLSANNQVPEEGEDRTVARFGSTEVVARKPATRLTDGAQFLDLAGDGQVDLVQMEGSLRGFYERTDDSTWAPFQPFVSWPEINTRDTNLKFVDLTGDGHADILITEGEVLTWYPSLAEEGFGTADRVSLPSDEEKGPRLVFADGTQSIYLADLSGDGLSDLVRIRNGEICYWPNLGYGHFGAKVTMDNSPWFDSPDQFDQNRIRLADTDGSGTTDIFYLRRDGVQIYFNQSGNRWSDAVTLPQFPPIENISAVQVLDLLGNGTVCLVWSSPLPGNNRRPMRYIALMEEKPHLLVRMKNNLGAETRMYYAPSTKFYLNDKQASKPWITRLPFPVHVVERVETWDWSSRNWFVTRYAYHHGDFDGPEREFRGFGMVEQWDTEEIGSLTPGTTIAVDTNWDEASYVPPVLTRTWFHTGGFLEEEPISNQYVNEYYHEGDISDQAPGLSTAQLQKELLADTILPNTIRFVDGSREDYQLSAEEIREACRSLKGAILRQEIYALDGTDAEDRPYTVSERNYTIELFQPHSTNKHAVFFTHPREQVDFHYERRLVDINGVKHADPRASHSMTLEVDAFGNALRALAIGYPRRNLPGIEVQPEQKETHMTLTVNRVANLYDNFDWYWVGVPIETRTYEVVKPPELDQSAELIQLFAFNEMAVLSGGLFPVDLAEPDTNKVWPYEKWDWRRNPSHAPAETRLRLIEHVRTRYRSDDLTSLLSLGTVESLALPGESYKLSFTPGLLTGAFGARVTDQMLINEGHYVHSEGDANWWSPSGRLFYSSTLDDLPASELAFAGSHFFLPHRYRDPFGNETTLTYDSHSLLLVSTKDALGNIMTVNTLDDAGNAELRNDYRFLQPYWVTDPNGNRVQVMFDALGMVVATAVMGKPGENKGDNLIDFNADITQSEIDDFHNSDDPHGLAEFLLKSASTRNVYDLNRFYFSQQAHPEESTQWEPPYAATLGRETHASDPLPQQGLKIQISFSYSDGFGREIQKKIQAEPGKVEVEDAAGNITVVDTTPQLRWIGSGWTIFNNKGKPARQYEPFFSTDHYFQFGKKVGVSPILFCDPVERVVATLYPNHTYKKVVFDSWQQTTFDVNDTVTLDPKTDLDINVFVLRLPDDDYVPTWYRQRINGAMGAAEKSAAEKAAQHVDTPTVAHFDTLGRTYLTIAHNQFERNNTVIEEEYSTRIVFDMEGNQREVIDAKDRIVMRYEYDMLGNRIHQASMEAGERWMLNNVIGKSMRGWDSRGFTRRMMYDQLQRPTEFYVTENSIDRLAERTVYGENQGNANNHRTRIYQVFDGAGIVTNESYDFKGNLLQGKRELLSNYQQAVDWLQNPTVDDVAFTASTEYDALNRPTAVTTPDHSVYRPTFNEANLLDKVNVDLRGAGIATSFVANIDYNAKGQRTLIAYANGATTTYDYDPLTYRLTHLKTTRPASLNGLASQLFANATIVQDLHYTYDPAGSITNITDEALPTIQYNNENVEPNANYIYDAIYRLISAQGREHIGQTAFDFNPPDGSYRDYPFVGLRAGSNDLKAVRNYTEAYDYDEVGNIEQIRHSAANGSWTRDYTYNETSLLESDKNSNRLTRTDVGNVPETYSYKDVQGHDVHGCMTSINSMQMNWDFKDQLQMIDLGGGGIAYYVYDSSGQRVRKVIHRQNGTKQKERIYLGGFEVYREFNSSTAEIELERETLHIMDDKQRVALVESRTKGSDPTRQQLIRYQFSNHLGSASLELDDAAQIISCEKYTPYGSTSYEAVRSQTETPKRYRYTSKEHEEETGLYYHGARYYACWLGKWTSVDPIDIAGGINVYVYCIDDPINYSDPNGTDNVPSATYDRDVMMKTDAQLYRYMKSMDEPTRALFIANTAGMFQVRAKAMADKYKMPAKDPVIKALPPKAKKEESKPDPKFDPYKATWDLIAKYDVKGEVAAELAKHAGAEGRDADKLYQAWNIAREDYRKVNLKGGDPILRNTEHFLFRRWLAHEHGSVTIPNGLPFMDPGPWNPTLPMAHPIMEFFHDPIYSKLRENILEKVANINKTTPDMYYFEAQGYNEGERLRESDTSWDAHAAIDQEKERASQEHMQEMFSSTKPLPPSDMPVIGENVGWQRPPLLQLK